MNHTNNTSAPVVLSVAGFDPSGGAGIAADLKTFAAHNCYGVAVITALTVQNTRGASKVVPVDQAVLKESLLALFEEANIKAIKIGMLANRPSVEVVGELMNAHPGLPVVLDPVIRSATGTELLDSPGLEALRSSLLSLVTVVTPNLSEAAALTGLKVESVEGMKTAAAKLIELGAKAVVVTGGHLEKAVDVYLTATEGETFVADRVKPDNTHGTGCTFSAAIAANLALGRQLRDAVMLAKAYVTEAIRKAYPVGPGRIPLNHLYRMQQPQRAIEHVPPVPETVS
jgi:hydroxymethylpyrimidine/phosphomethylpyrimidine kinase